MKTVRSALAAALFALASSAARAERPPLQSDFGRCANAVQNSGRDADLQGQLRMELLVRRDGKVYGAFVAGERGIDNRKLERCLTSEALLWVLPAASIDYQRSYAPVSFVPGGSDNGGPGQFAGRGQSSANIMLPDMNNPPAFDGPPTRTLPGAV